MSTPTRARLMKSGRSLAVLSVLLFSIGGSRAAFAQTEAAEPESPPTAIGTEMTLAEILYREGRQMMAERRFNEAAAKFAESYRLDPATGTLLNLATCREAEGKLASAWIAFSDAMRASRREQRDDRVKLAEERIAAIEPRLSRLTIDVPPEARIPDLVVRIDGVAIGLAVFGVPAPIDPGAHRIEASAPGKLPFAQQVTIGTEADRQTVTIPPLGDAPTVLADPQRPMPSPRPAPASSHPVPTAVYVSAGATALLIGASAITGAVYLGRTEPTTEGDRDSAQQLGWVNAGLWAASAIGAGITVYLYAARPERRVETAASLSTWANARACGVRFEAGF